MRKVYQLGLRDSISCIAVARGLLAVGSWANELKVFSTETQKEMCQQQLEATPMSATFWGSKVVMSMSDGWVTSYDTATLKVEQMFKCVGFSRNIINYKDQYLVLATCSSPEVVVMNLKTGKLDVRRELPQRAFCLSLGDDGQKLLVCTAGRLVLHFQLRYDSRAGQFSLALLR